MSTANTELKVVVGGVNLKVILAKAIIVTRSPGKQTFVGNNSDTHFDLGEACVANSLMVFVNGIKSPGSEITIDGDTRGFTLSTAPGTGWEVEAHYEKA